MLFFPLEYLWNTQNCLAEEARLLYSDQIKRIDALKHWVRDKAGKKKKKKRLPVKLFYVDGQKPPLRIQHSKNVYLASNRLCGRSHDWACESPAAARSKTFHIFQQSNACKEQYYELVRFRISHNRFCSTKHFLGGGVSGITWFLKISARTELKEPLHLCKGCTYTSLSCPPPMEPPTGQIFSSQAVFSWSIPSQTHYSWP